MRNFSSISNLSFHSYYVNCGEYCNSVSSLAVVEALADSFETSKTLVKKAWTEALNGAPYSDHVSPSEYEVLVRLCEFCIYEAKVESCDGSGMAPKVFTYINLNTGSSVIWAVTIC